MGKDKYEDYEDIKTEDLDKWVDDEDTGDED